MREREGEKVDHGCKLVHSNMTVFNHVDGCPLFICIGPMNPRRGMKNSCTPWTQLRTESDISHGPKQVILSSQC